jgi:hypothetical protein
MLSFDLQDIIANVLNHLVSVSIPILSSPQEQSYKDIPQLRFFFSTGMFIMATVPNTKPGTMKAFITVRFIDMTTAPSSQELHARI